MLSSSFLLHFTRVADDVDAVANTLLPFFLSSDVFLSTVDADRLFAIWVVFFTLVKLLFQVSLLLFPFPVMIFSYISSMRLLRVRLVTVALGYPVSPLVIHGGLAVSLLERTSSGLPEVTEDTHSEAEEMDCTDRMLYEAVELGLPFPVIDWLC